MSTPRHPDSDRDAPPGELAKLRARLAVAEETLRAIRNGEVDTVLGAGKTGPQVFTLQGAEQAYRVLIESMNEGALTLSANKMILYANRSFARMVQCPLEQITGSSFRRFLAFTDRSSLRPLMKKAAQTGSKMQVQLIAADGSRLPVQISIRELAKQGFERVTLSMVVTDMTEARRNEAALRALTHRVVQVQEAERGHVALELHDNVTQLLCAALFSSQALAASLSARAGPAKVAATELSRMLGQTAGEVERISRYLRPGVLEQLGLAAALSATSTEFSQRTHVPVELSCTGLTNRLPAELELALYRIFQEVLNNVEKHARARLVSISLKQKRTHVELVIKDDGVGFDPASPGGLKEGENGLGLLGMFERANYVGGALTVKSVRRTGTETKVRIPLPPAPSPVEART